MKRTFVMGLAALATVGASAVVAQQQKPATTARPVFTPDGIVHVPAFDLPPSTLISPEALALQKARSAMPPADNLMISGTIAERRAAVERMMASQVTEMNQRYSVDIVEQRIAGVRTRIVTPKGGEADRNRVLINLHGGGFMMCAEGCAILESVPVAAVGKFKVVTVDYRQGPENAFPAASEDVASVYQELLKSYRPENIGIYGCSAGGALTAQSMAWFADKKIPMPGAIGIFGAGGVRFGAGDSAYVTGYIDGSFPPPGPNGETFPIPYFRTVKMDDPLVSPAAYPEVAAKFPPTLLITGTRSMDMSPAIYTHNRLLKANVRSQLIVGEGMGHCYIYQSRLPEARDAYDEIVKFFDENLGHRGKGGSGPASAAAAPVRREEHQSPAKDCVEHTNVRTQTPGADGKFWFPVKKKNC
ncbi:MAG TPA: alpha/beta hydrolase [Sphingobium sp.]|uniref:alpha/beta hydrolase n=1 Tax=Sphingobium sp. TaxID=1912891 RepID=UPI002ED57FB1